MASDAALQFLKEQNRPYNAYDIAQNIGKEYGKAVVQKALDKLVSKDLLHEKSYGKQRLYCIKQPTINLKSTEENVRVLDRQVNELGSKLEELTEKLRAKSDELKRLEVMRPMEEMRSEKAELDKQVLSLKEKLDKFSGGDVEPISAELKAEIYSGHEKMAKEYRKRKRLCTDIVNAILEGYPKTKKHLIEEIGIETDEEVGFVLGEI